MRRWVARGLITAPLLPLVIGGMWAWDRLADHARASALAASPCVRLAPAGLGTPDGSASDGRCDAYYDGGAQITWVSHPWVTGETVVETWDWDGPRPVSVRQDGGGNRYLVVDDVEGGRVEVRGAGSDAVAAAVAGAAR
jgi:hypothetical protein